MQASRPRLCEVAIDIDEPVSRDLDVPLNAENRPYRPHRTDEAPGDNVVPERQYEQRDEQGERYPSGHVLVRERTREEENEVDDRLPREVLDPCGEINGVHLDSAIIGAEASAIPRVMGVDNDPDPTRRGRITQSTTAQGCIACRRGYVRVNQTGWPCLPVFRAKAHSDKALFMRMTWVTIRIGILRAFRKATMAYLRELSTLRKPDGG